MSVTEKLVLVGIAAAIVGYWYGSNHPSKDVCTKLLAQGTQSGS